MESRNLGIGSKNTSSVSIRPDAGSEVVSPTQKKNSSMLGGFQAYHNRKVSGDPEAVSQLQEQKEYAKFVTGFQANRERAMQIIDEVEKDLPIPEQPLKYGTAGFRGKADTLERAAFRVGLFVAIRAKITGVCGVMITASHNGPEDNGVKIVEKDGSMLNADWEEWAEIIVNSEDLKNSLLNLNELQLKGLPLGFDLFDLKPLPKKEIGAETLEEIKEREAGHVVEQPDVWPKVYVGWDTRESSPKLLELMLKGIDAVKCSSIKLGLVTTPQLHFVTMNHELNATVKSYIDYYAEAFIEFQHLIDSENKVKKCYVPKIAIDCANGVGALHILQLAYRLRDYLEILPFNDNIDAKPLLNNKCGAEFVQKEGHLPIISKPEVAGLTKMASFDGDADRLIYFWKYGEEKARVIDGDKQFALLTLYISQLLYKLDLSADMLILVNTGYANGQAVKFLEINDIKHKRVPTGVKNAHPITSKYVIGANDEPNGHGTIQVKWPELNEALVGKEELPEAKRLVGLLKMTNLAVGDAICNLLMIESVLKDKDFSIENFMSLYQDYPNKTLKVAVKDRTAFKTTWDETVLTQPKGLQDIIDMHIRAHKDSRCFVRPSGTEDVLRVYVEAATNEAVDQIAKGVIKEIEAKFVNYQPSEYDLLLAKKRTLSQDRH